MPDPWRRPRRAGLAVAATLALTLHWAGTGNPEVDLGIQASAYTTAALAAGAEALVRNRRRKRRRAEE